jgi:hypothetical protein
MSVQFLAIQILRLELLPLIAENLGWQQEHAPAQCHPQSLTDMGACTQASIELNAGGMSPERVKLRHGAAFGINLSARRAERGERGRERPQLVRFGPRNQR